MGTSMRSGAGLIAVLILAPPGGAQVPPSGILRAVGAADYSDGAATGIPRGSIFTITGLNLAGVEASVFRAPLPLAFNGLSVEVWDAPDAGAKLLAQAPLLYVSPAQINAVFPSSITAGQYSLRITLVSPPFTQQLPIAATDGRFTAFTRNGRGFGPAAIQQYDPAGNLSLNGLTSPAAPGAVMTLWGTGLGALPSGSDAISPQGGTLRADVTVNVAGIPLTPLYAGRAPGLPGVDQINFILPPGMAPRCFVPLQVQTGNAWSTLVTLAVSTSGTICDSDLALTTPMLALLDAGSRLRGVLLYFNSSTASPSGVVTQTAQTWMGDYDASDLSLLVNPAPARALPLCTRSDQPVDGIIVMPGPTPNFTGMSGCEWQNGLPGCIATGFSFGPELSGLSSTLPPPLPASEIGGLAAQYDGPQLRASWSVGGGADDRLSLAASSSYTTPSLFGADPPKTYTNTLSCEVAPGTMAFAFPAADAAWALEYGLPAVSLTLAKTTNQTFNLVGGPYDFLLLQMHHSVTAKAAVNY